VVVEVRAGSCECYILTVITEDRFVARRKSKKVRLKQN